jgi:hypothetical protein
MNGIPPIVRYMIICDDILTSSQFTTRPVIVGLTTAIHADSYPFRLPKLSVYLVLTDGRGQGTGKLRLVDDATGHVQVEFARAITFPTNPLTISGIAWRLTNLRFPKAGMYRIEFLYNNQYMAHQVVEAR